MARKSPNKITQTICLRSAWAATGGSLQWNSHPKQGLLAQLTLLGWTSSGSATPGVPVCMSAVLRLRDTAFKSPCPAPVVRVAVPRDPGYQPHMHRGALEARSHLRGDHSSIYPGHRTRRRKARRGGHHGGVGKVLAQQHLHVRCPRL